MMTRTRATALAMTAALALGACSKANAPAESADQLKPIAATSESGSSGVIRQAGEADGLPKMKSIPTVNAQLKVAKVDVKASPDAKSKTVTTLTDKSKLGSKTTLRAVDSEGDFVKVQLPTRPNGSTGWIERKNLDLRANDVVINVDLAKKKATVYKDGDVVLETSIATGSSENPTPKGTFYVTDLVQTDDAKGPYGPNALGLSAHSETLSEFGSGDGQTALHGTNEPGSIGKAVSHGCVRMPNETVAKLVDIASLGTPVVIS